MTNYIPKHEVNRLFTYDFFKDLDECLPDLVAMNPVFLSKGTKHEARMQKNAPERFQKGRNMIYPSLVEKNNLHTFEQGTFLIVHPYVKREDNKKALKGKSVQRWMLLAQWFDVDCQPLFHPDTPIDHVKNLHPISLSDAHLGLALMETMTNSTTKEVNNTLHVIQGPPAWLDSIEGPWAQVIIHTPLASAVNE